MNEIYALYHLKEMHQHLQHDIEHLAQLEAECTHITQTYNDMPGSPNRNIFKMDSQMARYLDYQEQVRKKIATYNMVRREVMSKIAQLPNAQDRGVLFLKYVEIRSNTEISRILHLKPKQTEYIISRATKHFNELFPS